MIEISHTIREIDGSIQPLPFGNRDKWLGCDFFLPLITQVTDDPTLLIELDRRTDSEREVSWNSEPVIEALELVKNWLKERYLLLELMVLLTNRRSLSFIWAKGPCFTAVPGYL